MTTNIYCSAFLGGMENYIVDTTTASQSSHSGSIPATAGVERPTPAVHSGAFAYNCDYFNSIIEHAYRN